MMLLAPLLPCPCIPYSWPLTKAPRTIPFTWEGLRLKSQPNHPLVNPNEGPKKGQTQLTIPANGSQQRLPGLGPTTLTGGEIKASGRAFMGSCIVKEGYDDYEAQHYAQWQVVAFRLPATKQEASGWWDAPPWLSWLCPQDFMPVTDASNPKDFWFIRQEKTLILAQALQACTKGSGPQQAFSALQCQSFISAWPTWWSSVGMT